MITGIYPIDFFKILEFKKCTKFLVPEFRDNGG